MRRVYARVLRNVKRDYAGAVAQVDTAFSKGADSTEPVAYFALFQEMQWVLHEPLQRRVVAMTAAQFRNNRQQWTRKVGRIGNCWVIPHADASSATLALRRGSTARRFP